MSHQHVEHLIVPPQRRRGVGVGVKMIALFVLLDALAALFQTHDPMTLIIMSAMITVIFN